jgi:hypothetical protein
VVVVVAAAAAALLVVLLLLLLLLLLPLLLLALLVSRLERLTPTPDALLLSPAAALLMLLMRLRLADLLGVLLLLLALPRVVLPEGLTLPAVLLLLLTEMFLDPPDLLTPPAPAATSSRLAKAGPQLWVLRRPILRLLMLLVLDVMPVGLLGERGDRTRRLQLAMLFRAATTGRWLLSLLLLALLTGLWGGDDALAAPGNCGLLGLLCALSGLLSLLLLPLPAVTMMAPLYGVHGVVMGLGRSTASLLLWVLLDGWRTACCDWLHAKGDTSMWFLQPTPGCRLGMVVGLGSEGTAVVSAAGGSVGWSCAEVSRLILRPACNS